MIITLDEFKGFLEILNSTAPDDWILTQCIESAQAEIEAYCGRRFESSTGTRYYRERHIRSLPDVGNSLLILNNDLLSVSEFKNGNSTGDVFTSTEYWLIPRNRPPYYGIELRTGQSWIWDTDTEVEVSGTWGYSTAADATLKRLVMENAAYLYRQREAPVYDTIAQPDIGIITVPKGMPQHVKFVLDNDRGNSTRPPYKRSVFFG